MNVHCGGATEFGITDRRSRVIGVSPCPLKVSMYVVSNKHDDVRKTRRHMKLQIGDLIRVMPHNDPLSPMDSIRNILQ